MPQLLSDDFSCDKLFVIIHEVESVFGAYCNYYNDKLQGYCGTYIVKVVYELVQRF